MSSPLVVPAEVQAATRRVEPRYPGPPSGVEVWSRGRPLRVVDRSAHGLRLFCADAIALPGHRMELELRRERLIFARASLEVAHSNSLRAGNVLGGRIRSVVALPSPLATRPGLGDAVEIRDMPHRESILSRLSRPGRSARLYLSDGGTLEVTLTRAGDGTGALTASHQADPLVEVPCAGDRVTIEAAWESSAFRIHGCVARSSRTGESHTFTLEEPVSVLSVARREFARVQPTAGDVFLEWCHPLAPDETARAPVRDLCAGGLRVLLSDNVLPPPPGTLARLALGGQKIAVRVQVRHVSSTEAGLQITGETERDTLALTRYCQALRWPSLTWREQVPRTALDELMTASGYSALRTDATPVHGWHVPPGDERLTVDLVNEAPSGRPIGHVSSSRIYPNTFLFHQLATLGLRRAAIAYPLYLQVVNWTLALTQTEAYALAYFDQSKRWHRSMFADFAAWAGYDSLCVVVSLDRLERDPALLGATSPAPATQRAPVSTSDTVRPITVREATTADSSFVANLARAHLPPLAADALHIYPETVSTSALCAHHLAEGLERGRTALVLEVDGKPEGAALCETGSRSISLFNILNMAQVFFSRSMAPTHLYAGQAALLQAVLDFYAAHGVPDPIVVAPKGTVLKPGSAGLRVVETMGCWAASREGLKQWSNYIHFTLGRFSRRRGDLTSSARSAFWS